MKIGYRQRLADFAGGLRLSRELARRERQPREGLHRYQQKRLESVVRHAALHSPFYRERLAGVVGEGPVELSRLPTLKKSEMMEHFDELVTDGHLRRESLLRWVEDLDHEELYLDRYRVMTTSGSSGHKGLFVFDRSEWRTVIGMFLRYSVMAGVRPRLPRRLRIAAIIGASPTHEPADRCQRLGRDTSGPHPVRNPTGRTAGRDPQPLPTRFRSRLSVGGDKVGRGAARWTPPAHACGDVHE